MKPTLARLERLSSARAARAFPKSFPVWKRPNGEFREVWTVADPESRI